MVASVRSCPLIAGGPIPQDGARSAIKVTYSVRVNASSERLTVFSSTTTGSAPTVGQDTTSHRLTSAQSCRLSAPRLILQVYASLAS